MLTIRFACSDIKEVKDDKNLFQKVSENLDGALNKNAQVNKNKPTDVMETENFLSATKSCFHHTALDYVNALTMLQARKKPEVLSTLLSYVQACSTYYHQGSDLCEDYDQYFKVLGEDVSMSRSPCPPIPADIRISTLINKFAHNTPACVCLCIVCIFYS